MEINLKFIILGAIIALIVIIIIRVLINMYNEKFNSMYYLTDVSGKWVYDVKSKSMKSIDSISTITPINIVSYGDKIYLVAREKAKDDGIYNYLLHKFDDLKLADKSFDKGNFDLQKYTNLSFGVYHGEILNVKLLFDKETAQEDRAYLAGGYRYSDSQRLFYQYHKYHQFPEGNHSYHLPGGNARGLPLPRKVESDFHHCAEYSYRPSGFSGISLRYW